MKEYRCKLCQHMFCGDDANPYCPVCDSEDLEIINDESMIMEIMESHHIHPKFMDNSKGLGEQFLISKKAHSILHGLIMKWIWEELSVLDKKKITRRIITRSKKWIGVK